MLNKKEMADRLGVHEQTVDRWAKHGIIKAHFYNDHGWQLYEIPAPNIPAKHCSRWDRLEDRAAGEKRGSQCVGLETKEV
jgi:predicted site-specific integrase-resolvase